MSDFLTRNRLVTEKVEVTAGVDSAPTPAADAVLEESPRWSINMELEQTDEATGTLDHTQSIVGGGYMEMTGMVYAKGSGTPGTAPEFTPSLQAAAMGMTTLAADSAGTAQAGAAGQITLAAGAPATDLTGFVIETLLGTGPGQTRVITSYNTATKVATVTPNFDVVPDATTTYAVRAGNLFVPVSTSLKTITRYLYQNNSGGGNAIRRKLLGTAANMSFAIQTRQSGKFTFTYRGLLSAPESVANPTGAVFDAVRPRPLRDADAFLGGTRVCFRNLTFDLGNQIVQGDCPGAEFGFDPASVTDRKITGRINPLTVLASHTAAFDDLKNGTVQPLWLNWGETLGNRVSILMKQIVKTGLEDDDLDKQSADGIPFESVGNDAGVYILFY
jgi:hypothetical protein